MKAYSFDNWNLKIENTFLLFFVQSMEEMLFHYGHDSYKVPALNFHFLCVEILSSIDKIENGVIDRGNMRPMFDELASMFSMDLIARKLYGESFESLFFFKNEKGEYVRNCSTITKEPESDDSLMKIRKVLSFLVDDMDFKDKYFFSIKDEINAIIKLDSFSIDNARRLNNLCRLFLTELINRGYSQEYIYTKIQERYCSSDLMIEDVEIELRYLFNLFNFKNRKYKVIIPLKKRILSNFKTVKVHINKDKLFRNSCKWIAEVEDIEDFDPEAARIKAASIIDFIISMKQFNNHDCKTFFASRAIVHDIESGEDYYLGVPITLLSRRRTKSKQQTVDSIENMLHSFPVMGEKLINAMNLHASALESKNEGNQLLNLWTILEILIDFDRKNNFGKIVQISNTLTTVLNSSYIFSLMNQLLIDLELCCMDLDKYLDGITKGNTEVEKLVALLVLPEFKKEKDNLLNNLPKYPLLRYRIEDYSEQLSNRKKIKENLCRHRKRLVWQIMRIYRNRNMLVHDGSYFPYIGLIIQNLHFYVDSLVDTVISYINKGFNSLDIVYALLAHQEFEHLIILEKMENCKESPISDDFIDVVLGNSYVN